MALFVTQKVEKKNNDFEPIPAGYYEMTIDSTGPDATKGGTEYIKVALRVRKDLDQALPETNGKYHNRLVFASVWRRKATGQYDENDLSAITQAAGYAPGTPIEDWNDWSQKLEGKNVRVKVGISEDTYQGKTTKRNQVWPSDFEPTQFPTQAQMQAQPQPQQPSPFAQPQSPVQINDNDLPF